MTFSSPAFVSSLPDVPDTVPLCDFMFDEQFGRSPLSSSLDAYTCGISGRRISAQQQKDRVAQLARALSKELGFRVNEGSEYDKVVGIFAYNTVDIMTLTWAVHRLNGISCPANAAYSVHELQHQLIASRCKALFTVMPLLATAVEAAAMANLPRERIYICEMPEDDPLPKEYRTISSLLAEGQRLPEIESIRWAPGQGARQTAFLCYSSGTSGLPKGVQISHRNVIANTIQTTLYEKSARERISPHYRDVALGLLPQSHIYGLVIIAHASTYRGDNVVILPKFDLNHYLMAISKYRINTLYLVPPILITMANNRRLLDKHNLSSVRQIFSGAAPLAREIADDLLSRYPGWIIRQAYGLTESCTVVTSTHPDDVWLGSSGCLLPGAEIKIVDDESGQEITSYDRAGELWVKAPSVVLGYLENATATRETFVDVPGQGRFLKTGDKGEIKKSPESGNEHLFIVDRIKELIKVKGHQVAPAELEAYLLNHPAVADCAVISVPDDVAGEVPKAFIVRAAAMNSGSEEEEKKEEVEENSSVVLLTEDILQYVRKGKTRHKWLAGGIEYVEVIPKSPSGKILRRLLRDRERSKRRKEAQKL